MRCEGVPIVLSAPSGVGKTTIARALLKLEPEIVFSISMTTRKCRQSEEPDVDYHFVNHDYFKECIANNEFLEFAEVYGQFYGTPRKPSEAILNSGRDILFVIDWQGYERLCNTMQNKPVGIFILPPSFDELRKRLHKREPDKIQEMENRLSCLKEQAEHYKEYDYVVINDDIENAVSKVRSIITAERLKRSRLPFLKDLVDNF